MALLKYYIKGLDEKTGTEVTLDCEEKPDQEYLDRIRGQGIVIYAVRNNVLSLLLVLALVLSSLLILTHIPRPDYNPGYRSGSGSGSGTRVKPRFEYSSFDPDTPNEAAQQRRRLRQEARRMVEQGQMSESTFKDLTGLYY